MPKNPFPVHDHCSEYPQVPLEDGLEYDYSVVYRWYCCRFRFFFFFLLICYRVCKLVRKRKWKSIPTEMVMLRSLHFCFWDFGHTYTQAWCGFQVSGFAHARSSCLNHATCWLRRILLQEDQPPFQWRGSASMHRLDLEMKRDFFILFSISSQVFDHKPWDKFSSFIGK